MVIELSDTQELVVHNFDDEPIEEGLGEDPKMGEPQADHCIKDAESAVFRDDTNSSFA